MKVFMNRRRPEMKLLARDASYLKPPDGGGRRPRSLFIGFVEEQKNDLLAAGPPAAAACMQRDVEDQCRRPRQVKRTLEKNAEFFSISGAPGAGPILCWEGAVAGVGSGAPPQWRDGRRAQRQGTTCPGRGKGGAARPKTPPSVSLAQMAFWARRVPPQEGPKVSGPPRWLQAKVLFLDPY